MTARIRLDAKLTEILEVPLVKSLVLQISAEVFRRFGFEHPMGENWRGIQDIDPAQLPREKIIALLRKVDVQALRAIVPCGSPHTVARVFKGFVDAGMRVPKILDYSSMAGLKSAARSPGKILEMEDELIRLVGTN